MNGNKELFVCLFLGSEYINVLIKRGEFEWGVKTSILNRGRPIAYILCGPRKFCLILCHLCHEKSENTFVSVVSIW
jgi:hypothetical protein